jgi:hypothetical protein
MFGDYKLKAVLSFSVKKTRIYQRRLIPKAMIGDARDETAGGVVVTVQGEIRDPDCVLRVEELRRRADDLARLLDLEDGSGTINAKLGTVDATWDVERGLDRVAYTATFYETS